MIQPIIDLIINAPGYALLGLTSIILLTWISSLSINLYQKNHTLVSAKSVILAMLAAETALLLGLWQIIAYKAQPETFPAPGSVIYYKQASTISPETASVTIKMLASPKKTHTYHLLTLSDAYSGVPMLQVYVESETSSKIAVPLGDFNISVESGPEWYGPVNKFGKLGSITSISERLKVEPGRMQEMVMEPGL